MLKSYRDILCTKNEGQNVDLSRRAGLKCLGVGLGAMLCLTGQNAQAGWKECSIPGCPCRAFMGNGDLCENCGHQWTAHF